jgi:FkbM family methyltransferase
MDTTAEAWPVAGLGPKCVAGYLRGFSHRGQWRLARLALRAFPSILVSAASGGRFRVDPLEFMGWQIIRTGSFEARTIALAAMLLEGGGTFVDVGANFGLYTCALGVLPGVNCVAIEPGAEAFERLRKNLALNPTVSAQLFHLAVGAETDIGVLTFPCDWNIGQARLGSGLAPSTANYAVGIAPLETVLAKAHVARVDLLKIDVEGYELQILRAFDWRGPRRPRHVIMELNSRCSDLGETPESCAAFWTAAGYRMRRIDGTPYAPGDELPEENLWLTSIE